MLLSRPGALLDHELLWRIAILSAINSWHGPEISRFPGRKMRVWLYDDERKGRPLMKPTRRELLATAAQLPVLLLATRPVAAQLLKGTGAFDEHQAASISRLAWLMFPIKGVAEARYQQAALLLNVRPDVVIEGVAALDELAGGRFLDLAEDQQVALMKEMQTSDFFITSLDAARIAVLNDKQTWALIGYEGSSLEFGGYIDRGLNDIDWLPTFDDAEGAGHE
jgi:hypothetical protein